jgi:hypothetical protein
MICDWNGFCDELLKAGFSIFGGNDEGIFGLIDFDWQNEPPGSPIRWHTGDPDTDPWEWRMRVLAERDDISYGKVFFRKGGFITREWCPYFLAARRDGRGFHDIYADGLMSVHAKRIMDTLAERRSLPAHELKSLAGFAKDSQSRFEKALTDLQMGMFITICGSAQKRSKHGEAYGWHSMVYCLTEDFWPQELFASAARIGKAEAIEAIAGKVYSLNKGADKQKVMKFITG